MKILVAGDSYCDELSHKETDCAWTRQLEKIIPNASVTCIGQTATSVFSALKRVREIKEEYDAVIVIVTSHERMYQTSAPYITNLPHALNHQELYKREKLNDIKLYNKIEASRAYYEFLYEDDLGIFILESCLKEFQLMFADKRLILVPGFNNYWASSYATNIFKQHPFNLMQVIEKENLNFTDLGPGKGRRWQEINIKDRVGKVNHMCQQNQLTLANYFADLINASKSSITLDNFISLPKEDFRLHFRPIDEVQYSSGKF